MNHPNEPSAVSSTTPRAKHGLGRRRPRHRRQAITFEPLERRQVLAPLVADVLAGSSDTRITGTVYEDLNSNGIKDAGDDGLQAWRVYIDLDGSGTYNTDAVGAWEPSALTNGDGDFIIARLIPGTYRVAEVLETGWNPTAPLSREVVVTRNRETKTAFFNFAGGAVEGAVWNDLDRDGVRAIDAATSSFVEPGLAGWTVFVDVNGDRSLDADDPLTVTDGEGRYRFAGLAPADYEVYVVLPDGWEPTRGSDVHQTVAVAALETGTMDFGYFSDTTGSLRGTVWNDLNFNGTRDTDPVTGEWTDPGVAGWTAFIDLDGDGVPGLGEPTTLTDADGRYVLTGLAAGGAVVAVVLPERWNVVEGSSESWPVAIVAGATTDAPDVAVFTVLNGSITGTIWNDRFRDGRRDVIPAGDFLDPGLAGWTVFLDRNRNRSFDAGEPTAITDSAGGYSFSDLQVGDYELFEVVPAGWEPTLGFDVSQTVTVVSGATTTARDFANFNLTSVLPGSVGGTVWNDLNGDGIRDLAAGGGFADPGIAGRLVFIDGNGNGVQDAGEPGATTATNGTYTIASVAPGTVTIVVATPPGWIATAPASASRTVTIRNGGVITGVDFGSRGLQQGMLAGTVFHDADGDGVRDAGEGGLPGITVYLDLDDDGVLDAGEPRTVTSDDKFFTPAVDEAGTWEFTHLPAGPHVARVQIPDPLSATPASGRRFGATLTGVDVASGLDTAARYRSGEIRGTRYSDADGDGVHDPGEAGIAGARVYLDLDRDGIRDAGEPATTTGGDGSYAFAGLDPEAYVVRDEIDDALEHTYPTTHGGTLWPSGTSNPAVGMVTPTSITASLAAGESLRCPVSITLPSSGALTNLVDVFLLFDDTGSFVGNSPIVRGAFPTIIAALAATLPGSDLAFGVGRFEEYGTFSGEYATGRPFVLNQPIVASSTAGSMAAIQAALDRTTPGYGGDAPETDIEALFQLVTGRGFDGNNNGSVLDSGPAGLAATQLSPGASGDVPSFASFVADVAHGVLPAAGTLGGGGFRAGALPIILLATDVGFAYQPRGETVVSGAGGLSLPVSDLTRNSRPTTPFSAGAGLQETITALNALGGLVIGLGTNAEPAVDPRAGLEAISKLTGAINRSAVTIANGTADPIAPGDPLYFQIASGFASSVATGVVNAIQNAATSVAVDLTVRASDPRVRITNHTGVVASVGAGRTAAFDIEFTGDGLPHRFDLQFVRSGTGVVMGSIPVVLGTPIPGDGYSFEDCRPGEIHDGVDFGVRTLTGGIGTTPTVSHGGSLAALASLLGEASTPATVMVSGTNLTAAIVATAPAGFEVSSDGVNFGPTAEFAPVAGSVTGTLRVRLAATAAVGTYAGDVSLASAGAATVAVATAPSTVADELVFDVAAGQTTTYSTSHAAAIRYVKRGTGTLVLDAAGAHTGSTTVEAGTLVVSHGDALASSAVQVNAGGRLAIATAATMRSPGITVGAGGLVTLPNDRRQLVALASLVVDQAGGGRIDIGRSRIDIATGGTTEAALRAAVVAGRNAAGGGGFNGTTGIMTSGGAAGSASTPAVGYRVLASGTNAGAAVVAWAAFGDANLDGQVNQQDISLITLGRRFNQGPSASWADGDMNYSNAVNQLDISLIGQANLFNKGSYLPAAPTATAYVTADSTTGADGVPYAGWIALAMETQTQTTKKR